MQVFDSTTTHFFLQACALFIPVQKTIHTISCLVLDLLYPSLNTHLTPHTPKKITSLKENKKLSDLIAGKITISLCQKLSHTKEE